MESAEYIERIIDYLNKYKAKLVVEDIAINTDLADKFQYMSFAERHDVLAHTDAIVAIAREIDKLIKKYEKQLDECED